MLSLTAATTSATPRHSPLTRDAVPHRSTRLGAMSAPSIIVRIAGISGCASIGLGAYGAHGLKVDANRKVAFENANKYHMINSAMLALSSTLKRPALTGGLFAAGTLLFSGSCYAYALSGDRKFSKLAPVGGVTMMVAWLSLVL